MKTFRLPGRLAAFALLAVPASAVASSPAALPPVQRTLTAAAPTTTWTAPMSGFVTVRLDAASGDWDLAVADAASTRTLVSSGGFRAHEVAQTWVTSGQRLTVRGLRRSGARRADVSIRLVDAERPSGSDASLVRVASPGRTTLRWLEQSGFDVTHNMRAGYADVIVPSAEKLSLLKKTGLRYTVREADLGKAFARARAADAKRAGVRSALPSGRSSYRQLADYQRELKEIVAGHGAIAKPVTIGQTFQGRDIGGVELASDVAADDGRPIFFLVGEHHAREWPSSETAMEFAWLLAKGYGTDAELTDLLTKVRIVIVPIVNVDGFFASRAAAEDGMIPDPADSTGAPEADTVEGVALPFGGNLAYRRKNCNGPVPGLGGAERDYPCYYQWGVDPNRNYGEGWGGTGAGSDPNTQSYRGAGQWSEPETQAVHEYAQTHPVSVIVSLHNVAALVLRPPGNSARGKAPDEAAMKVLGDRMADVTGYTSQYSFQLYDTSGGTEDWNYAAAGSYGYTIELGPVNGQFHEAYQSGVVNQWEGPSDGNGGTKGGMRRALLMAAQTAADPASHAILEGTAAPGTILRLQKSFATKSAPVCTFSQGYVRAGTVPALDCVAPGEVRSQDDALDYTTRVGEDGTFEWHVTQSTRPFVGWTYREGEKTDRTLAFTGEGQGSAPVRGARREYRFAVDAADRTSNLDVKLDWTAKPEDYNLYLSWINPATNKPERVGEAQFVEGVLIWTAPGNGASPNGFPEHIVLDNPKPGAYVAEVHNVNGVLNDYTLTVATKGQKEGGVVATGVTEAYTLTCLSGGDLPISEPRPVTVERGQRLDLGAACG